MVSPSRPEQSGILWHHFIAALQVGAEFLALHYPVHTVLLPNPTWANHNKIFPLAGIKDVRKYRYFKPSTKGLDYEVMMRSASVLVQCLTRALQHGAAHFPISGPGPSLSCALCYINAPETLQAQAGILLS